MLIHFKKIIPLALICLLPFAANAKVTPISEYSGSGMKSSAEEQTVNCTMYGYYETPQYNADCTQKKLIDGTKCFACTCNKSTYQFTQSQCNSEGFVPGSGRCTVGTVNLYSSCDCNSSKNYLLSSLYVSNVTSAFTYGGTNASISGSSGKKITCYQYDKFTCKSGTKLVPSQVSGISGSASAVKFKAKDDSPYLTYTAKSTLVSVSDSKTIYCTSAVSPTSPLVSSTPTGNDCAEYSSLNAKYYNNQLFYYFNGNCSNSGKCTNTSVGTDCAVFGGNSVTTYNSSTKTAGSVTCKYTTGCLSNYVTKADGSRFLCAGPSTTAVSSTYFTYTDMSAGNVNCRKVTGCASGYTLYAMANGTVSAKNTAVSNASNDSSIYLYDVGTISVSPDSSTAAYTICRTPSGCRNENGYYDKTCPTGCWNGLLSWWYRS